MTSSPLHTPAPEGYEVSHLETHVTVETRSSATLIRIAGEVDGGSTGFVASVLWRFLAVRAPLVVDLTACEFLSVGGARLLLEFNNDSRCSGLHWALVVHGAISKLLDVTDRCRTLPTAGTVAEALARVTALHTTAAAERGTALRLIR